MKILKLLSHIFMIFSLVSCSLFVPRRSSFEGLERGTGIDEVKGKFGKPNYDSQKSVLNNDVDATTRSDERILTYEYCTTPLAQDILLGWLTLWIYAWNCDKSSNVIALGFNNNELVSINDNLPENERRSAAREASRMTMEEAEALGGIMKQLGPPASPKKTHCEKKTMYGKTTVDCTEE